MKIIILTLAIYVHAAVDLVLGATTTEEYPATPEHSFEAAIEDKCFENSHSKYAYQNLIEAAADFDQCERKILNGRVPHPVEQHDEFCRYFEESQFYSCMENLANNALPCLGKSELFFPQMILEAYNTTFDTLCGTNGLRKTEYFFNKIKHNHECMRETLNTIVYTGRCIENLNAYKNFMQFVFDFNQLDYCNDMESLVDCATELVEQQCDENFSIVKFYFSDLFLRVCQKSQNPFRLARMG